MITGLPQYQPPIEQSLRCLCGQRFVIYAGGGIGEAQSRARERAAWMGARFIDAREVPFLNCECGQFLDFTTEEAAAMVN